MALTRQQLDDFRARLTDELRATTQEIAEIDEQVRSFADTQDTDIGVKNHIGDDADVMYEQERLMTIRWPLTTRKAMIERALEKIDRGTYGLCENCGKPINAERLAALPFVSLCIECQERQDRQGGNAR